MEAEEVFCRRKVPAFLQKLLVLLSVILETIFRSDLMVMVELEISPELVDFLGRGSFLMVW